MTHSSAGARTRIVGLLLVALLVPLVGTLPAEAAVDTSFSCPGTIAVAGFTDTVGHDAATRRAIDCLAVHDITQGTSPTTFNPSGTVPRWQMALFLVRQAESHGMTVPAAVDQGFTDLGGLSVDARTAVNQLAQLGITLGTSETTFSPHQDVTRWQMALFITRLLAGSGVGLPAPTDQGFDDLVGLSDQATAAIDQLAMLGVAEGTSAETFSPDAETLRWHMALFLTRALAVGGILPPGVEPLVVSPSGAAFLDFQGTTVSRQYTVGVSTHGPFSIELWPASLIRTNATFEAASPGTIANCDITLVDGSASSADKVTGIEPSGSTLAFTVGCVGTGDEVVPVVYTGSSLTGLGDATSVDAKSPTNDAVGIGGGATVVEEATSGAFGPVAVDGIDDEGQSFTSGGVTYFWDSNDTFKIDGVEVTMAEWIAALTTGDDLLDGSSYDPDGSSVFDLQDDSPVAPGLSLVGVTSTTATLTYTAAAGSDQIEIHACEGTGCETTLVRSVVAGTDEDDDTAGTQLVITGLTPATDYDFQAVQIEGSSESEKSDAVDVDTPVALSIVDVAVNDVNDSSAGFQYLFVTFDDDVDIDVDALLSDFQIHVDSQPDSPFSVTATPSHVAGETDQLALEFSFQADTDPDTDWVLTIHAGALDVGAGGDPNGELTAEFSH